MAKGDTFFLRTTVTQAATSTDYTSDNIDITGYVNVPSGRVLVVDRAFVTFTGDGNSPLLEADVGSGAISRGMTAQVCSEIQTGLVSMSNNSLMQHVNLYCATNDTAFTMIEQENALNPGEFTGGFIVPTNQIHCGVDVGQAWAGGVDVGFLFEVHTEKLSLTRIQELLVSLTAN